MATKNPFAAIDEILSASEPVSPSTLLEFAKQNGYRVTSGFSRGGHNTGSMHYQGSPDDPGAIDIDHRGVDYAKLLAAAQALGYNVRDERTRPKGQAVWGGPHFHLSKGGKKQSPTPQQAVQPQQVNLAPAPQMQPVDMTTGLRPVDLGSGPVNMAPLIQEALNAGNVAPAKLNVSPSPKVEGPDFSAIDQILVEASQPKPVVTQPKPKTDFFSDLSGGFQNAISGFTRDDLVRQSGGGFGAGLGTVGGSLLGIAGTGLAGAGAGSILPGAGTAGGALAGVVAGGTSVGALQEAQRQRLAGEDPNLWKIGGAGAIGALSSLPVGGAASTIGRTILKNAAVDAGINTAGDLALQAVEQGTLTPQVDIGRSLTAAGIGAAGGGLAGAAHAKIKGIAPQIADKIDQGLQLTEAETRVVLNTLTTEEIQALNESWRQRTVEPKEIITPEVAAPPGYRMNDLSEGGIQIVTKAPQPKAQPDLAIDRGLPEGRPEPEPAPNVINPVTGKPYDLAGTSAQESAKTFTSQLDDVKTAEQLRNEAVNNLRAQEQNILGITKTTDVVEAQRTLGQRINELESKGPLSYIEGQELTNKRTALDNLLQARKQLQDAESLLSETQQVTPRSSLDVTPEPPKAIEAPQIRSSLDLALDREPANITRPQKKAEPIDLGTVSKSSEPPKLLDAQGKPVGEAPVRADTPTTKPDLLDATGRPRDLSISKPDLVDAQGRPLMEAATRDLATDAIDLADTPTVKVPEATTTREGAELFTHGAKDADIEAKIRDLFKEDEQFASIAAVEKHLKEYFPEATTYMKDLIAAARGSKILEFDYNAREAPTELRGGRKFAPMAFSLQTIKPSTERAYLRRLLGDDEAVIDHLTGRIREAGGEVHAADLQTKTGKRLSTAKQITRLIKQLDDTMGGNYLKSPRVFGLNIGESTRGDEAGKMWGYRLDTLKRTSLTNERVNPEGLAANKGLAEYKNDIGRAFTELEQVLNAPGISPDVKKIVTKVTQTSQVNYKDIRKMRQLVSESLEKFCNIWGLK